MRAVAPIAILLLAVALTAPADAQPAASFRLTQSGAVPSLAPVVKKVSAGVVGIAALSTAAEQLPSPIDPSDGFPDAPYRSPDREVVGAGVIIDADHGLIVTNYHVIADAERIVVSLVDGHQIVATKIGDDPDADIAVIKIVADGLTALPFGDSDKVEVGDYVLAIGNPFGLGQTVTHGIVSALHRKGLRNRGDQDFIQTDAPINQGNSGGALVNLDGELVGINAESASPDGINVGIGFAIPVNAVREIVNQMAKSW